ncbi:MAG: NADH-quinone oxidoreductase subunit M [Cyclobacteriaceae bacterium]|nr:NADH-quinone oxidoreductase subunit M [Cyclobacteriaceae bacterium]MCB0498409.1 NADH-quinone oxidoreductase subunit M [Cyclobacteriaceae bacterium]MCB9237021.1 NADH-quinone oxidoreductase subunit M [Flammeovirgaceae bacterium]MCO5271667.1 NADH-quinone oxidoreductase subunit M [Cyclobacteriaceae bacterium]MCW5901269.1 NADH-quinone oxidoreductase subunit M [Cyclobacteriaceae bacterium]
MNILTAHIAIPALTALMIMFVRTQKQARAIAAIGMALQLALSFLLLYLFLQERANGNQAAILFAQSFPWYPALGISFDVGVDGIAVAMILLTSIVIFTGIMASWEVSKLYKEFFVSLIVLATGVYGFFVSLDLFLLFLFFELAVIPMYLLIGIWGSGPKEYAAMKLTLMLMGGSALLIVGILGVYFSSYAEGARSFNIIMLGQQHVPIALQRVFFPILFIGFGVIGALFPFHTWSPDGHSSAPTAVSMLHAGVLMKLGGYGCLKVAIFLLPEAASEMAWVFIILTSVSVIYGALATVVQTDLKYINAYSSVSHCGLVLFGILMLNKTASTGAVLQMVSHGLMTALFFALIGMLYARTNTRTITQMGGLMKVLPFLSVCYVIAGLTSLGLPGLSGFVAEMTIFVGAFEHDGAFYRVATFIVVSSIVVTAVYILRVIGILLMGPVREEAYHGFPKAKWFEKVATISLIVGILVIGLAPLWLSDMIRDSLGAIVDKLASR